MSNYYKSLDQLAAGSGSGYGCYCPKDDSAGGLSDLGLLAAGAAAVFLLYQAITMMTRRKKRDLFGGNYGTSVEDFLWTGTLFSFFIWSIDSIQTITKHFLCVGKFLQHQSFEIRKCTVKAY